MKLPPKGDPRRPLHLAIRSLRVLALLFILIGGLVLLTVGMIAGRRGGPRLFGAAAIAGFYLLPGLVYIMLVIFLRRRQFWAVVTALVLVSLQELLVLAALAAHIFLLIVPSDEDSPLLSIVLALVAAALGQLIYHLALSFESIKYIPVEEVRGFEPVMPLPVQPPSAQQPLTDSPPSEV